MNNETFISLYIMGGLFAVGLFFSTIFDSMFLGLRDSCDIFDKTKLIFLSLLFFILISAVNMIFSWAAAGFWLMQGIQGRDN